MKCKCPESGEIYNIYNVPILFTQELLPLGLTENDLVDRKKKQRRRRMMWHEGQYLKLKYDF